MNIAVTPLIAGGAVPGGVAAPLPTGVTPAIPSLLPTLAPGTAAPYTLPTQFTQLLANLQAAANGGEAVIPALTAQLGEDTTKEDNANTALPEALLPVFAAVTPDTAPVSVPVPPAIAGTESPPLSPVVALLPTAAGNLPETPITLALPSGPAAIPPTTGQVTLSLPLQAPDSALPVDNTPNVPASQPLAAPIIIPALPTTPLTFQQQAALETAPLPPSINTTPENIVIPNTGIVTQPQQSPSKQAVSLITPVTPENIQLLLQEGTPLPPTLVAQVLGKAITDVKPEGQQPGQQLLAKAIQDSLQPGENFIAQAPITTAPAKQSQGQAKETVDGLVEGFSTEGEIAPSTAALQEKTVTPLHHSQGTKAYTQVQGDATLDTTPGHHHLSINVDTPGQATPFNHTLHHLGEATKTYDAAKFSLAESTGIAAPWEQISVKISQATKDGHSKITLQLEPASLGKVDIRMDFTHDGKTSIVVAVDKPETLELLKQDSRQLERALSDAGIKTDSGSLSFNLRDGGAFQQQQQFANGDFAYQNISYDDEDEGVKEIAVLNAFINTSNRPEGIDIRV